MKTAAEDVKAYVDNVYSKFEDPLKYSVIMELNSRMNYSLKLLKNWVWSIKYTLHHTIPSLMAE